MSDKLAYGGVEEPEDFAERFSVRMEAALGVERAKHMLVKGDGAEWICQGAAHVFPGHVPDLQSLT